MNHFAAVHQNGFAGRSMEKKETTVCPKPLHLDLINAAAMNETSGMRTLRWHVSNQQDVCDAKARNELLDLILAKDFGSSPPFFVGSPPSRVSNPLIHDPRFGDERFSPLSQLSNPTPPGSGQAQAQAQAQARKNGCNNRANFGNNPAVRVEGFECGIRALA